MMKLRLFYVMLSLVVLTKLTCSLKILAILPYQGKSHFFVFQVLLRELADRGHLLTVISRFPQKKGLKTYIDIALPLGDEVEESIPIEHSYSRIFEVSNYLSSSGIKDCETMLSNKKVQWLVGSKIVFDIALVELFNSDCGLGLAHKLNVPIVGITTHVLMPYHYARLGIPYNPAYDSFHFLGGGTKPSLYQKIERTIFNAYFKLLFNHITQPHNQETVEKYLGAVPHLEDLARTIKLSLLYHNFVLTGTRLLPSNVIEVGGYHVGPWKRLTGELEKFVEESEHGVIYISFGTVAKSSSLSPSMVDAILYVIDTLPQRFVWKLEGGEKIIKGRKKVYVAKWLPQIDILAHYMTVAFFSHGGMLSTTEAIHYGVPMVVMPLFGDQPSNAAAIEESGLGVSIQVNQVNRDSLLAAFNKVLIPGFHQKVKEVSKAWRDRPRPALETAVFWVEFAGRHSKFNFTSPNAFVSPYHELNMDVWTVILGLPILLIYLCSKLVSLVKLRKSKKSGKRGKRKPKRH